MIRIILLASLREAIGQGRNAGEKLQNAAKAYLRFYRDNREYFRLLFFFDMFSDHARIPETLLKEIRNRKIACLLELQGVVKDTGLQGRTAGGRTTAHVSLVLWGMINGIIQLAESRQVKEEDLDRLIGVGFEIATLGLGQPVD